MRFNLPFLGVVGNNSAMNQIRCGQIAKYGPERGEVANKLGDVHYDRFAEMLGGLRRGGPGTGPDPPGAGTGPGGGGGWDAGVGEHLGRHRCVGAGHEEPDDVQVRDGSSDGRRGPATDGRALDGHPRPRHDARADGAVGDADLGVVGCRRDQGRAPGPG